MENDTKEYIVNYLYIHNEATLEEISEATGKSYSYTVDLLKDLWFKGYINVKFKGLENFFREDFPLTGKYTPFQLSFFKRLDIEFGITEFVNKIFRN